MTVEKYLTPEQQKQKEEEEKAEEERRRREQGDNARERALDQMMVRLYSISNCCLSEFEVV